MSSNFQELVPGETCFNLNFSNPGGTPIPTVRDATGVTITTTTAASIPPLLNGNSTMSPATLHGNGKQSGTDESGRNGSSRGSLNLPNGKKTKGRVKIKMEFIDNKLRRYTTFSKRKTGIMKKAYELSTLTGTQVMLLVASETGHVYTFATKKLQPMITSEAGKALIQTCLNSPDSAVDGANGSDGAATSSLSTNFHTADISSTPSSRKRAKLEANFSLNDDDSAKSSPKSYYQFSAASPSGLPTMVPPTWGSGSLFRSESDGEDDDEDEEEENDSDTSGRTSPSSQNLGSESASVKSSAEPVGSQQPSGQNQSGTATNGSQAMFKMPNGGQFLLPGFIPTSSCAGLTTAQATAASYANLGFVPSLTPNGAVMYQMPQGLVYAPNPAMLNEGAGQNFLFAGFPQSSTDQNGQPQQQFITIPVPFPMGASTVLSNTNGSTNSNSASEKEETTEKSGK